MDAFTAGDGAALARERKALPAPLSALYTEVRRSRETGLSTPDRLEQIVRESADFTTDWLLYTDVAEMRGEVPARRDTAHA